jgi:hypothetical protein
MTIPRPIRKRGAVAAALCSLLVVCSSVLSAQAPASEYQVKAAFLLNFTRFIEWPAEAFAGPDSSLTICVLGDDPFGGTLDQVVEGEKVKERRLAVQRIRRAPKPKSCQVLFAPDSERDVGEILTDLGPGVLTVGEGDGFLRAGGMIGFIVEGRHVRFDINLRAAANASLNLNARLLNVARTVHK